MNRPLISFVLALCSWYQVRSDLTGSWLGREDLQGKLITQQINNSISSLASRLPSGMNYYLCIFFGEFMSLLQRSQVTILVASPLGCHPEWMIASYYSPPAFCTLSCHQLPVNRCSLFFLNILQSRDPFIADRHCVMSEPAKYMEITSGFRFSEITTLDNGFLIYTDLWSLALDLESFCVYCF